MFSRCRYAAAYVNSLRGICLLARNMSFLLRGAWRCGAGSSGKFELKAGLLDGGRGRGRGDGYSLLLDDDQVRGNLVMVAPSRCIFLPVRRVLVPYHYALPRNAADQSAGVGVICNRDLQGVACPAG